MGIYTLVREVAREREDSGHWTWNVRKRRAGSRISSFPDLTKIWN